MFDPKNLTSDTHSHFPIDQLDQITWKQCINLIDIFSASTLPRFVNNGFINCRRIEGLFEFFPKPLQEINLQLKDLFPNKDIQIYLFLNVTKYSPSFPRHNDTYDIFHITPIGEVEWEFDKDKFDQDYKTAVWVPKGIYHKVEIKKTRISFAFDIKDV